MSKKIDYSAVQVNDGLNECEGKEAKGFGGNSISTVPSMESNFTPGETGEKFGERKSKIMSRDLQTEDHGSSNDKKDVGSGSSSGVEDDVGGVSKEYPYKEFARARLSWPNVQEFKGKGLIENYLGGGMYGTVCGGTLSENDTEYNYVEKYPNCPAWSESYKHEIGINEHVRENEEKFLREALGSENPDFYHLLGLNFIPKFIGHDGLNTFMEKAEGKNLYDIVVSEEFRNNWKSLDVETTDSGKLDELKKRGNEFKNDIVLAAARDVTGISLLNYNGVIHRDHKPENTVHDLKNGTSKVVDLGLANKIGERKSTILVPYCSSYEEYSCSLCECSLKDKSLKEGDRKVFLESVNFKSVGDAITHPAADVYGIGMNLVQTLFVNAGMDFICRTFKYEKDVNPREDAADNLEKRDDLSKNLHDRLVTLNNALPKPMRYTQSQLLFIEKLIGSCIDSNPLKRPTAAQVAYMLELLGAEVEDFDVALSGAMTDRPTPKDYFSPSTIEAYEILGIIPENDNWISKNGVVHHKLQQSSLSSSQQPSQSETTPMEKA